MTSNLLPVSVQHVSAFKCFCMMQKEAPEACSAATPLLQTLHLLVADELALQRVLLSPLEAIPSPDFPAEAKLIAAMDSAWHVSPALAAALAHRFRRVPAASQRLLNLTMEHAREPQTLAWAQGAPQYAAACHKRCTAPVQLAEWAPLGLSGALGMLIRPYRAVREVRKYVMRCLSEASDDQFVFWLPQVVQQLRGDKDGALRECVSATLLNLRQGRFRCIAVPRRPTRA